MDVCAGRNRLRHLARSIFIYPLQDSLEGSHVIVYDQDTYKPKCHKQCKKEYSGPPEHVFDQCILLECGKRNSDLIMLAILIDKYLLTDSRACKILLTAQVCLRIVIDDSRIGSRILRGNLLYIICIIGTVETLREFSSGKHTGYDVVRIFLQDHVCIGMYP